MTRTLHRSSTPSQNGNVAFQYPFSQLVNVHHRLVHSSHVCPHELPQPPTHTPLGALVHIEIRVGFPSIARVSASPQYVHDRHRHGTRPGQPVGHTSSASQSHTHYFDV